jgi:hypothetical protein
LGGVTQTFFGRLDHTPHVTDAFGALGGALAMTENIGGLFRPGLYGLLDVPFADAVAIAHVHGALNSRRAG